MPNLWPFNSDEPLIQAPRSDISCQSCRKRKIKCDRQLPQCVLCKGYMIPCRYPDGPLKPGPKTGSIRRARKPPKGAQSSSQSQSSTNPKRQYQANEKEKENDNGSRNRSEPEECQNLDSQEGSQTQCTDFCGATSLREPTTRGLKRSHDDFVSPRLSNKSIRLEEASRSPSCNVSAISFILHPAHEASSNKSSISSPRSAMESTGDRHAMADAVSLIEGVCDALDVERSLLSQLIIIYFDHMVAINLFHEPTFTEKVSSFKSQIVANAFFASMLAFASRFLDCSTAPNMYASDPNPQTNSTDRFLALACKSTQEALVECGDDPPCFELLQAFILTTYCQLIRGVRGKAWRLLGTCVRLCYELHLHLIDSTAPSVVTSQDSAAWRVREEKRRAWWAVWEMDVFASTVRRCPTAIDWTQIETLLPIDDESWFCDAIRNSSFLELDLTRRWRDLRNSGNTSHKAWFIVVNSFMKEAQSVSSPRGAPDMAPPESQQSQDSMHQAQQQSRAERVFFRDHKDKTNDYERLELLSYAVRCSSMALPEELQYHGEYLSFEGISTYDRSKWESRLRVPRQRHFGIYNIYLMLQLARLMIHHYGIFRPAGSAALGSTPSTSPAISGGDDHDKDSNNRRMKASLSQYFEAAESILYIVHRCSDDHIQHINPFLSSTIWLAAAVQLLRRAMEPHGPTRSMVMAKFEVLVMTYQKCVHFWDLETAMQKNLELLFALLEQFSLTDAPLNFPGGQHAKHSSSELQRSPDTTQPSLVSNSAATETLESPKPMTTQNRTLNGQRRFEEENIPLQSHLQNTEYSSVRETQPGPNNLGLIMEGNVPSSQIMNQSDVHSDLFTTLPFSSDSVRQTRRHHDGRSSDNFYNANINLSWAMLSPTSAIHSTQSDQPLFSDGDTFRYRFDGSDQTRSLSSGAGETRDSLKQNDPGLLFDSQDIDGFMDQLLSGAFIY